jgi:hypothetical protein
MNLMIQTRVWLIGMSCNAVYCGALKCVRMNWIRNLLKEIIQNKLMGKVGRIIELKCNRMQGCLDGLSFFDR